MYQPQQIKNFKTGIQQDLQPWLIAEDAQEELFDGYVHHGTIYKRDGYRYFATGLADGSNYRESRIVRTTTSNLSGTVDGANLVFTFTPAPTLDMIAGTITVNNATPSLTLTDDGAGGFTGDGTGTVNYTTGAISITFSSAPTAGTPTVTYTYYPDEPVLMIANFINSNGVTELIVANKSFVNKYNLTTFLLQDITGTVLTGDYFNFFTYSQYPTIEDKPRLLFTNNKDQIQCYDGTDVSDWYPVIAFQTAVAVTGSGDGTPGPYSQTLTLTPPNVVVPNSLVITAPGQTVTDDGMGNLIGCLSGSINYTTGSVVVTFNSNVPIGVNNISYAYDYATSFVKTCLLMANFKDRLLLFNTTEAGVVHEQRIRISGTGQSGDKFSTDAIGAGLIDIPTPYPITGVEFNRDDVIIYTRREHWILTYTGNDVVPFSLKKLDGSRGCGAPFSTISYLNLSKAFSQIGYTITDGYQVQRNDQLIPDFSFTRIDQDNFKLLYTFPVDDDNHHLTAFPTPGESASDQILVQNYEEGSWSIYKVPISCGGTYFESQDITWTDLLKYPTWGAFAADYSTWNEIGFSKDSPIALAGGHHGEIWSFTNDESEDNPVNVYNITQISTSPLVLEFTTDWHNYTIADSVFVAGISGATEVNNKVGYVSSVTSNRVFRVTFNNDNPPQISAYTSGGRVSRTIPFEMTTKNFNPFSEQGQKVRCGYIYLYIDATQTLSTDVDGNPEPTKIKIEVFVNDQTNNPTQVFDLDLKYESAINNFNERVSKKVWRKVYINQNAEMIQFRFSNKQPGTKIRIQAIQPSYAPGGRLI